MNVKMMWNNLSLLSTSICWPEAYICLKYSYWPGSGPARATSYCSNNPELSHMLYLGVLCNCEITRDDV